MFLSDRFKNLTLIIIIIIIAAIGTHCSMACIGLTTLHNLSQRSGKVGGMEGERAKDSDKVAEEAGT